MVFLAISHAGYSSYLAPRGTAVGVLWLAADVVSEDELSSLREAGADATEFNYTLHCQDQEAISSAVETIKEHHPGEPIWVEA